LYFPYLIFRNLYGFYITDKSAQVIFALCELLRFIFLGKLETIGNLNKTKNTRPTKIKQISVDSMKLEQKDINRTAVRRNKIEMDRLIINR